MYTVFITGPLAAGKRQACLHLAKHGFRHLDLDELAKEFLTEDAVVAGLTEIYGKGILNQEGQIHKPALAAAAFASPESSKGLNGVIWPLVTARVNELILGLGCAGIMEDRPLAIEVALLAEMDSFAKLADHRLCITATKDLRIERALGRNMELSDILNRMALQVTDEVRAAVCDTIIENNGSLESLEKKLDDWLSIQRQEHLF